MTNYEQRSCDVNGSQRSQVVTNHLPRLLDFGDRTRTGVFNMVGRQNHTIYFKFYCLFIQTELLHNSVDLLPNILILPKFLNLPNSFT